MIVPSIDIVAGTTVQLVGGEQPALDAGDPLGVLERFARVGEVAVVDIDAARGEGDNTDVIERDVLGGTDPGRWWDAGASKGRGSGSTAVRPR